MSFRNSMLSSLAVLAAATAIGCNEPQLDLRTGRVELAITPTRDVRMESLRGSFEIRGLDSARSVRLAVHGARYQVLTAELPGGAYSVTWHPELSFELGSVDPQLPALASPPQMIVIAAAQMTRVAVRFAQAEAQTDIDERISRR